MKRTAWIAVIVAAVVSSVSASDEGFAAQAEGAYRSEVLRAARSGALDRDPVLLERSRRIFGSLTSAASRERAQAARWAWEIHTTEDPATSAYCLAGGKVMLGAHFARRLALDDAELAMLLGHEIAHALAGHRRAKDASAVDSDPAQALKAAAEAAAQEHEADALGMALAHQAGWPLEGLAGFFDKLAALEPAGTFSATHERAADRALEAHRIAASLQ